LLGDLADTAGQLSDLLDYENAQIAHLNERALNGLVKETKEENSKMRILTVCLVSHPLNQYSKVG
jgi:hypothetical protein